MELLPGQDGYEVEFAATLTETGEVAVPFMEGGSPVDSMDKTGAYIMDLIARHELRKIGARTTVTCVRYMPGLGHHLWVHSWDPSQS